MAKKPLYKIDKGSIVKGTGAGKGYLVCTTTPDHPGKKLPEHDKVYVYVHVVKMENKLGRQLKEGEVVDHKDGNPLNNELSNLRLTTKGPHHKQHAHKNKPWKHSPGYKKMLRQRARKIASIFLNRISNS